MKLRFLALSFASVVAVSAVAQEVTSSEYAQTEPAKNVSFKKNKASDNWFIQLQGGTNIVQGFGTGTLVGEPKFLDRLGYSAGLGIGKWHNPYFGTRLMIDWNWLVNNYMPKDGDKYRMAHNLNPHFDFVFDMMNYFGVYNPNRVFSIKPYLGVGYAGTQMLFESKEDTENYLKKANFTHTVTGNLGASFDFRFGKRVSLNIAPSVVFGKFLNNVAALYHKPIELMGQLKAGLTFDAGRTDWEVIEPMDYALLNDLNSQINALRAENAELSKRPVNCPDCPEATQTTVVNSILDNVVYFRLNSAVVDKNQLISVFNTAEFVKANKTPIKVVGYADEKTGTSAYNMSLSEKRAKEVARILVDEYGVPSELITIDWKGSDEQPYAINAWNRVVIMKANN